MREELSEFMNGESVKLIARFIRYGCMKFDGEGRNIDTNPITGIVAPMEFFKPGIPIEPMGFTDSTSLIVPLSINDMPIQINKESHMWVVQHLKHQGHDLAPGSKFQAYGHINAYKRVDGTRDFSFDPYSEIEIL